MLDISFQVTQNRGQLIGMFFLLKADLFLPLSCRFDLPHRPIKLFLSGILSTSQITIDAEMTVGASGPQGDRVGLSGHWGGDRASRG